MCVLLVLVAGSADTDPVPSTSGAVAPTSEHSYFVEESPRKLKRSMFELQERFESCQKKLKVKQQAARRLTKKVETLEDVVKALKEKDLVSDNCVSVLEKTISGVSLQLVLRQLAQRKDIPFSDRQYPPELRSFALTLHFYSAKAYNFVRETFDLALPHPKTLSKWYRAVDGNAGFSEQALRALQAHSDALGHRLRCALVMDEMAIRRQVEWDGKSYVGFIDMGTNVDDDCLPVAKEALVFLAVSITDRWKIPVGYFLIDGLNGSERANLVSNCISKLYEVQTDIVSLTFDGSGANLSMASVLGCTLQSLTPVTSFVHPSDDSLFVQVLLDPCHMLKLMRNLLAEKRTLSDDNGEQISWEYLVKLQQLQAQEGLKAGNKLTERHINWTKQKMKVNLAAQTLSSSVADALEFCRDSLGFEDFAFCGATVRFIRIIDRAFDILNSRNPFAKGYKAPLRIQNEQFWRPFVNEVKSYLWELKLSNGDRVCTSNRKTGIIGFVVSLTSFCSLFDLLVAGSGGVPGPLQYLLGYKFSQDHIELFFCAVRGRGGWNNNPTARQFKAAYKRLLVHQKVKEVATGNVTPQEPFELLGISSHIESEQRKLEDEIMIGSSVSGESVLAEKTDHDYSDIPDLAHLSMYVENVVLYIAGFVVKRVLAKISCVQCMSAVTVDTLDDAASSLLTRKNRGGLMLPAPDVVLVCKVCERVFRTWFHSNAGKLPAGDKVKARLINDVLRFVLDVEVFSCLDDHVLENDILNDHRTRLVKLVCNQYLAVRLFHAGKVLTRQMQGDRVRSVLSKTIIFKGQ